MQHPPASGSVVPVTVPKPLRSLGGRRVGDISKASLNPERDYLLLDRSGSMSSQWGDALGAINTYARTLGSRVNTRIMMAVFDEEYDIIRKELHPLQW